MKEICGRITAKLELPYPKVPEPEQLLFAAEIFLDAPSGEVKLCNPDDIFFGREINVFSGSGYIAKVGAGPSTGYVRI